MLQPIVELDRLVSFSSQPHAVAIDGDLLYVSSRATRRIDVIDRNAWQKWDELDAPGMPWGMTYARGELIATCGEGTDDLRRIRRYASDEGWQHSFIPCPDDTGSHLAVHDGRILLGQWYNQVVLELDDDGAILRRYEVPHGLAGVAIDGDKAFLLTTDDEDDGDYWITRLDLMTGVCDDVALVPFHARGLAWDEEQFWTNHREADRTVRFRLPS
ncbi:MAG: hypothetical protein JO322_16395 [Candidatus Eremiobacteraeota bacterium]|nr:hypothetical protein [Candidatus Eremiobacteraeota bacterium]